MSIGSMKRRACNAFGGAGRMNGAAAALGNSVMRLNSLPSKVSSDTVLGKVGEKLIENVVDGAMEGYGLDGIKNTVKDVTTTISRGAAIITSPLIGKRTREEHQENMQHNIQDIQGDAKESKKENPKTDEQKKDQVNEK